MKTQIFRSLFFLFLCVEMHKEFSGNQVKHFLSYSVDNLFIQSSIYLQPDAIMGKAKEETCACFKSLNRGIK